MTTYTTVDSINVERLLLETGVVKCQHKHKFSDVVDLEGQEDFCFVCFEPLPQKENKKKSIK